MTGRKIAFQVVFTLLTLNFAIPALTYLAAPERALAQLDDGLALAGLPPFPAAGETGVLWRTLAGTNVLALAFMCALLQWDLERFYPVLAPLAFLKGATALAFLGQWLAGHDHPLLPAIAAWDALAVFLMIFFASRARAAPEEAAP